MGTRSDIIVHRADGTWARVYCHWDGYLSNNGRILFDHYNSQALADRLVKHGDLSKLGAVIGVKHPFDAPADRGKMVKGEWVESAAKLAYDEKYGDMCLYYGRDRGEKDTAPTVGKTIAEVWPEADTWTEFTYVWDDGKWWVGDPDKGSQMLIDLGDALSGKTPLTPDVKIFGGLVIGKHKPVESS